ncbi:glycosyltransferase family 4 protein [Candidatus Amarolinea dominans]|uniref:glycosyltransferase family 4 protein n=1 Tax=Candidatus Amarolinea dominans TaxID=3140696 RepID=UPI00313612CC|nr:glycosyltransferase family 4 protein [Anaerolineae bacterium]
MSAERLRLALATFYPARPDEVIGGIDSVAVNLVQGLAALPDLELHVVSTRPEVVHDVTYSANGVTFHALASPPQRLIPNLFANIGRVSRVLRAIQPDVVHAHNADYAVAALRLGLPTLYTVHGLAGRELRQPAPPQQRLALILLLALERLALRRAPHVAALSAFGEAYLRPHTAGQIHRVDNPVSTAFFALPPAAQSHRLIAIGSIVPLKGQLTLVAALALLHQQEPAVTLRCLGSIADRGYHAQVLQAIARHGLQEVISVTGLAPPADVVAALGDSAVLLHPSRHDHVPMAVAEAMAAGRPVVATRAGGIPGLVSDGVTGYLVPVGDAAALAGRTLALLRDADLRQTLGAQARQAALARFLPTVVAARYHSLYRLAAGSPSAPGR